jgi:hypothetical protein
VYGEDDVAIAALPYTYYERIDVSDVARRPLFISFNGGPGSGSLWMHLGYTSPKQQHRLLAGARRRDRPRGLLRRRGGHHAPSRRDDDDSLPVALGSTSRN